MKLNLNILELFCGCVYSGTGAIVLLSLSVAPFFAARAEARWAQPDKVGAVMAGKVAEADVSWWGYDAEDSTRFLQAAMDSPAKRLVVPVKDSPWIVEPLVVNRDDLEMVFEQGVVVEAKKGSFLGRNSVMMQIWDRKNIKLKGYGATLRMRKREYWQEPYKRSEWRHCLDIRGSIGVTVEGLTISGSGGDGIYVSATKNLDYSKDVTVRDVDCFDNNRQGMSVITVENMLVERCIFRNTIGTAPMAGIDFEPNNAAQRLVNIIVRDSLMLNNSQLGMHVWLGNLTSESEPVSITWERNYVRGSEIGMHVANAKDNGPSGYVRFRNNMVQETHHAGILMRLLSAKNALKVEFENNILLNTARRGPYDEENRAFYHKLGDSGKWWRPKSPSAPIVITAQKNSPVVQGGITFKDDLIIHDRDEPVVHISGPWDEHKELFAQDEKGGDEIFQRWENVTGSLRVINPAAKGEIKPTIECPVVDVNLKINRND